MFEPLDASSDNTSPARAKCVLTITATLAAAIQQTMNGLLVFSSHTSKKTVESPKGTHPNEVRVLGNGKQALLLIAFESMLVMFRRHEDCPISKQVRMIGNGKKF